MEQQPESMEKWPLIAQVHKPGAAVPTGDPHQDLRSRIRGDLSGHWDSWRTHYEDHLRFAERHGRLADKAFVSRLQGDTNLYLAAVAELEAGKFLEDRGGQIEWEPPGRGTRVGEMRLTANNERIFVEVKGMLPGGAADKNERISGWIWEAAESLMLPFTLGVWVERADRTPSKKRLSAWLLDQLSRVDSKVTRRPLLDPPVAEIDYDGDGVRVHFSVYPMPGQQRVGCMTSGTNMPNVRKHLHKCLDSAHPQLPEEPNLVLIRPFIGWPIHEFQFVDSIFGTSAARFHPSGEVTDVRHRDGWLLPHGQGRLSAVGLFNDSGRGRDPVLSLDVIHNPFRRHGWNWETIRGPRVRHLVPDDQNNASWRR